MKILANDGISESGIEALNNAGFEVTTETVAQDNLIDEINKHNYVGILVRSATKVRKDIIDACPGLKLIGRGGVGMDNIDVAYAREKGLHVINTPAASSQSVAELVMGHLFSVSRGLYDAGLNMPTQGPDGFKSLKKKYGNGIELRGKKIGIIGFGRIGQATAKYALGCGMQVLPYDNHRTHTQIDLEINGKICSADLESVCMDKLLAESDFISLHVPAQKDGIAVLDTSEFSKMKKGVMIINAARGGVVNEDALISAIDSGIVSFAALDVFENEPNPREDLLKHPKIATTPHIGAATNEAQDRIGVELAEQISDLLS